MWKKAGGKREREKADLVCRVGSNALLSDPDVEESCGAPHSVSHFHALRFANVELSTIRARRRHGIFAGVGSIPACPAPYSYGGTIRRYGK